MVNNPNPQFGLTLPELIVTVVISGILLAMAVPSFTGVIASNRVTSFANQLVTALNYARSEAIKRGLQVSIRHKDLSPKTWSQGWDIFTDEDGDGLLNNSNQLLKTYDALPNGFTLTTGNIINWLAYLPAGNSRSAGLTDDTFKLCDNTKDITVSRSIVLNKLGRVRVKKGTTTCP